MIMIVPVSVPVSVSVSVIVRRGVITVSTGSITRALVWLLKAVPVVVGMVGAHEWTSSACW
ncbi:hypothetical protein JOE57_001172 [Microlunatus panaciterrae]|uniref:Uncharacterized protein n=1 Tax=Microlunatus panaciterrae TaxID=400768 RepID=A0ABS2RGX6_9ACTN|nr:hypothetical protein [Microlunatus panaciterrae]